MPGLVASTPTKQPDEDSDRYHDDNADVHPTRKAGKLEFNRRASKSYEQKHCGYGQEDRSCDGAVCAQISRASAFSA